MDADAVFDDPYRSLALRWKDELQAKDEEIAKLRAALARIVSPIPYLGKRDSDDLIRIAKAALSE